MRILTISGSLRAGSANSAALDALAALAPPGMEVVSYEEIGRLPFFDPDLDDRPPPIVRALRQAVGASDGLVIASPEYAHGVAGVMKNALDWLVGSLEFPGKPVLVLNTSPRARHADAHLRGTLATMSARLVAASAVLPLMGRRLDAPAIAADADLAARLVSALGNLEDAIRAAQGGARPGRRKAAP